MYPLYLFLLSVVLTPLSAAQADILNLPASATADRVAKKPVRGMSMQEVIEQFGQPERKLPPVGDPPITRWKYPRYTVYFEGKYVIHAVPDERN